jgi:hypothetical protein
MANCRAIREIKDHETPVVMVAAQEDPGALANKLARIAWTVLAQERSYESRVKKAAA